MKLPASIPFEPCGDVAFLQEVESRLVSLFKYTMLSLFRLSTKKSVAKCAGKAVVALKTKC